MLNEEAVRTLLNSHFNICSIVSRSFVLSLEPSYAKTYLFGIPVSCSCNGFFTCNTREQVSISKWSPPLGAPGELRILALKQLWTQRW